MMKSLRNLAVAAAFVVPAVAQAQIGTATLTLAGHPYSVSGGGGFSSSVFNISFTGGPRAGQNVTLGEYLVWCIDETRTISSTGGPYTFDVYSFYSFGVSSLGNDAGSNPSVAAMNRIASHVDDFQNDAEAATFEVPATQARKDAQRAIWDNFNGLAGAGDSGFDSGFWYVLYNDRQQTLAFRLPDRFVVPEPGSLALIGTGLFGMVVVARRRRSA